MLLFLLLSFLYERDSNVQINFFLFVVCFRPSTPSTELLRVTVTCSETDEKNATFKVVTKVSRICKLHWFFLHLVLVGSEFHIPLLFPYVTFRSLIQVLVLDGSCVLCSWQTVVVKIKNLYLPEADPNSEIYLFDNDRQL